MNAYTGEVKLYQWSNNGPGARRPGTRRSPASIKPTKDIPAALMAHLRYPEVLFEAQRQILAQYHVQQAQEFYGGQNFWTVPVDPSGLQPEGSPASRPTT